MNFTELESKTLDELRGIAKDSEIIGYNHMKKQDLVLRLMRAHAEKRGLGLRGGVLEIVDDSMGFLRGGNLMPSHDDIYVSQSQLRRFSLRTGDMVIGQVRAPKDSEKYHGLIRVESVNGLDPRGSQAPPAL
ncbi:transcription termination factor Rho [Anaerolineaceae bacterium]|nr:transcription termination factor Rho [Anaerolineaceae bacterium]